MQNKKISLADISFGPSFTTTAAARLDGPVQSDALVLNNAPAPQAPTLPSFAGATYQPPPTHQPAPTRQTHSGQALPSFVGATYQPPPTRQPSSGPPPALPSFAGASYNPPTPHQPIYQRVEQYPGGPPLVYDVPAVRPSTGVAGGMSPQAAQSFQQARGNVPALPSFGTTFYNTPSPYVAADHHSYQPSYWGGQNMPANGYMATAPASVGYGTFEWHNCSANLLQNFGKS
ncbi:hypothetical protein BDN72DRAFT_906130 [Pluteus cervinus]|uniref:Uncharacterized protein n=1 Tax=Pluteus cervinus TaxID=181527 RepID=A0ACD3A2N4_9AGAR|nr:hypothetical protein BDN72DRAFT_906130 [Pluteus cervinus]